MARGNVGKLTALMLSQKSALLLIHRLILVSELDIFIRHVLVDDFLDHFVFDRLHQLTTAPPANEEVDKLGLDDFQNSAYPSLGHLATDLDLLRR